jgi:hypothetical protein
MKSLISACCLVLLTAVSVQIANADIAKPNPIKSGKVVLHAGLEIVPDPNAYEARLQITEADLKSLNAGLAGIPSNNTMAASITQSSTRTIIAGLLMFLSVSIAGILFARASSFGRAQKTVAAVILVVAVLGAAAIITRGNAGPPGSYRWRNLPKALADGKPTRGGVDVEIIPDDPNGRTMRLIIPLKTRNSGDEE